MPRGLNEVLSHDTSHHSSLLVSSSSSSATVFLAGFFFFFLFLEPLAPVDLDRGFSRIERISSSVIFLSVSKLETFKEGGAANLISPFLVIASHSVSQRSYADPIDHTYGCEKPSDRGRVFIRDNFILPEHIGPDTLDHARLRGSLVVQLP